MTHLPVHHFGGRDGVALAYREMGCGRPLVLLHGFFSTASVAWIAHGHAVPLAARGHRVIMPDLRGHGDSARPHDAPSYPPDVLTDDGLALIGHLELTDYDLAGYSLGARIVLRMLARGATPRRAVVGGAGYQQILDAKGRGKYFRRVLNNLGTFEWGSAEWEAEGFLRKVKGDPEALLRVLDTTVDTTREELAEIAVPTMVLSGADDDPESGRMLATVLPHGRYVEVPGHHIGVARSPQLHEAIADYLD